MNIYVIEIEAYHEGVFIVVKANSVDDAYEKSKQWALTSEDFENYHTEWMIELMDRCGFKFPDSLTYKIHDISCDMAHNDLIKVGAWSE